LHFRVDSSKIERFFDSGCLMLEAGNTVQELYILVYGGQWAGEHGGVNYREKSFGAPDVKITPVAGPFGKVGAGLVRPSAKRLVF
jgi:hypothetical protein